MAVNDLMMRIQLLTDTGKSTAELQRLQRQLQALTNQLKSLERTSLSPLANDLKTLKAAQDSLKATNLQTFAKTLADVKTSFSGLGLSTAGVDQLQKAFADLEKQTIRTSIANDQYKKDVKTLNDRLKEVKQNQLTGDGQSVNQKWIDANDELTKYNTKILQANEYIRDERQWIQGLKSDLANVKNLYEQQRAAQGQASSVQLNRALEFDSNNLKFWQDNLKSAKNDVVGLKDNLKQVQVTAKTITLKQGIADALADSNSKLSQLVAQQRSYSQELLKSNNELFNLKRTLSEVRNSDKITFVNGSAVRSISTIKDELRGLKAQQKDALKLEFNAAPLQLFEKLATRANATSRKIVPKFDTVSITSLADYNQQLSKQQQNVLRTQSSIKGYQDTLRSLRLEMQRVGVVNLDRRDGNLLDKVLRIKNEIQSINSAKGIRIEVDDKGIQRFVGGSLTSLQNKLREIKSTASISEAFKIAPINAQVKSYNAEFDVLKQINNAYKENAKAKEVAGAGSDAYKNSLKDIVRLEKELVKLNPSASSYTGDAALVQRRMTELEQEAALGKLKSSLIQQDNIKYQQQSAEINKLIGQQKNQIALKNDEKKAIDLLIQAERNRARLAANEVKTRSGGLLDTVALKNAAQKESDLYRGNVASLKQYLETLKQAAKVRGEGLSGKIGSLSGELLSALGLESIQKRLIANEQRRAELTKNNLLNNKSSREAEVQAIQKVVEANRQNNQLIQEGIKSRITTRQSDVVNLQTIIAGVKQRIEADKQALATYKEGLQNYREGIQQQIFETQQRIASGQLTKQQYNDERAIIRSAIAEQKELSRTYQQQLKDHKESLKVGLEAEKANSTALKNQVKDLMALRTEEARRKAVDLTRQYNASQTTQGNLQQQIREAEASAKAEILRANALAQSANAASKAKSDILGLRSALGGAAGPLREFSAALGFMFGPQMAGFAAAGTIMALTNAFIDANKQVEQLVRGLNAISGGNGLAEFRYLVDVSNKLGVSLQESAHSFLQLEATTAGTAIEGAKTKQIFESFARALNVTGADAVTFNRAFRSISQSLSKGQLYAEELKGQLAEALPGAIQVFAKAIDVTPKKFLAMVKAGQFTGQTLYDLFELVAKQLDNVYKVGNEQDFTFIQKANLAKNAFIEFSIALGNTGVWKTLSDGMLLLRDGLKSATEGLPNLTNTMTAEWQMIKALYAQGASEVISSLSTIGEGWRLLAESIPDFIKNISFQSLLDLPATIKQIAIDALTEIKVMATQVGAEIDRVGGKGTTDKITGWAENVATTVKQWTVDAFVTDIQRAAESAAALSIYIDKIGDASKQRKSDFLFPEGFKISPAALDFDAFLKSFRSIKIEPQIEISQNKINAIKQQIDSLQKKIADGDNTPINNNQLNRLKTELAVAEAAQESLLQTTLRDNYTAFIDFQEKERARVNALKQRGREETQILADTAKKVEEIRKQGEADKSLVEQQKTIRDLSIETAKQIDEATKREQQRTEFYRSYNQQLTQSNAARERDVAITQTQIAYERKRLDVIQAQRDAEVDFAEKRYNAWVKSGSMSQESADFLINSAKQDAARKAIKDAQDAVEAYNAEVAKGEQNNETQVKLLREQSLELLKMGMDRAKQIGDEYKYKQLVEERIRLLSEERTKANEGADAVYKAKIKAENPQAQSDEAKQQFQNRADQTPITYRATIQPDLNTLPSQQDGLMFASLRNDYQQTQQVLANPLRFVVDDNQVNAALQSLNVYQNKIQDVRTNLLANGKTEIIVTPRVDETSLRNGFQFIKTSAAQAAPTVTITPVVNQPAVAQVKKTAEEVRKDIFSILDKNGKPVNFIVKADGVTSLSEDMKRLTTQKEIPVSTFVDQSSIDQTKKKFDETGSYIKDGLRNATTIAPQNIQNTLDTAFGKGKYKMEIVPTLVGGVTEDGWIKSNEIKRNLIITPISGDTTAIDGMIKKQSENVKSGYNEALQQIETLDKQSQQALEAIPVNKTVALNTDEAYSQDAALVNELSTTVRKVVEVVYRSSGSASGSLPITAATGGYLPGYGGGDRIHALLEAGEFILRKEAVRKLGLENVFALNNLAIPKPSRSVDKMSIPTFASGGYVGGSTMNLNISLGGKNFALQGSRDQVKGFAEALTKIGRAV